MRGMTREQKQVVAVQEKDDEQAAIAKVKERIAQKEYSHRGGYQRIMPLDFETTFLKSLVGTNMEKRTALKTELEDFSVAADNLYQSIR